jgi:hypothetical protein
VTFLFGPPLKSYKGIYPTPEEARALTEKEPITPTELFKKGRLLIAGSQLEIGVNLTDQIATDLRQDWPIEMSQWSDAKANIRALLLNGQCIIVRISSDSEELGVRKFRDNAILIDATTMKPFARYSFNDDGRNLPQIPRYYLDRNTSSALAPSRGRSTIGP